MGVAATALPGLGACDSEEPVPLRPKGIVMITADDLGWKDLGSYGLESVATPAIDRLVNEGVAFDNAFDVVSSCSSSRAALATGQYPHTNGVMGLVHRHPELSLPTEHPNAIRLLAQAGYQTAIQGKWHLSAEEPPTEFGYGEYLETDFDQVIRRSDDALTFLEANRDKPFYLELNYMQTHRNLFENFLQAEGFEVRSSDALPPSYWGLPNWPEIQEEVAGYLSQLRWMDALIGEILAGLDSMGLTQDTLVVFISDNGPPFPGCKTTLYDRGVGTPLVFRWPGGIASSRHSELVSSVDVAPTVLELAGGEPLPAPEGRSLAPLLLGDESWVQQNVLFSEMERHSALVPARAARTQDYKYIRNFTDSPWGSGDGNGAWKETLALEPNQTWDQARVPEELYYLPEDPLERENLVESPDHEEALLTMRALLSEHMNKTGDFRKDEL